MFESIKNFLKETFDKEALKVAFRNALVVTGYTFFSGITLSKFIDLNVVANILPISLATGGLVFFTELMNYYKIQKDNYNTPQSKTTEKRKLKGYTSFFHLW